MWVDNYRNNVTGRRDIRIGEPIEIPEHYRTVYTGELPIGTEPRAYRQTFDVCPCTEGRAFRSMTAPTRHSSGGVSYVGFGLAICNEPDCQFVVSVKVDRHNDLVILRRPS